MTAPRKAIGPALILIVAAMAAAPVRLHGPYCGDDFQFHLVSWLDAQQSWRHGIPYPHWAPSPNFGAGEPRFIFYPPLTWMLGAALGLVLPWVWVPVVLTFLLLSATGLATFALARRLLAPAAATLAAIATIFSGYVLYTAYERAAFAELAGGFWMPLLLLFALRDRTPDASPRRRALDGSTLPLALVVAGAWLSNAPVGVMASYLLATVALTSAVLARSWFPVVRAAIAGTLGIALAAIYLIPAAWEQRWVDILEATGVSGEPGLRIENNWLFGLSPDPALKAHNIELRLVSQLVVVMIAIALLSALAVWLRRRTYASARRTWIVLACIPAAVLFLQLPLSLPIWNLLPKLHFLQFPWRWMLVLEAPMGILLAAAVWPDASAKRAKRIVVTAICSVLLLASLAFATKTFFRACEPDGQLSTLLAAYRSGLGFWGAYEYAPPGADNSLVATGLPDACLTTDPDLQLGVASTSDRNPAWSAAQGSCAAIASAEFHTPEHLRISTTSIHSGFLILRLRSYPAWRITVNGRLSTNLQQREDGLVAVPVPQGTVSVAADWTTTPDAIAGRSVTAVGLLLLPALWFLERKKTI
jgi:hypothetical protein